jgi:hypothetical protein
MPSGECLGRLIRPLPLIVIGATILTVYLVGPSAVANYFIPGLTVARAVTMSIAFAVLCVSLFFLLLAIHDRDLISFGISMLFLICFAILAWLYR